MRYAVLRSQPEVKLNDVDVTQVFDVDDLNTLVRAAAEVVYELEGSWDLLEFLSERQLSLSQKAHQILTED